MFTAFFLNIYLSIGEFFLYHILLRCYAILLVDFVQENFSYIRDVHGVKSIQPIFCITANAHLQLQNFPARKKQQKQKCDVTSKDQR